MQEHIYGRTGLATANFLNYPGALPLEDHEVRVQRRQGERLLDAAGWKKGADGIRDKDGKR